MERGLFGDRLVATGSRNFARELHPEAWEKYVKENSLTDNDIPIKLNTMPRFILQTYVQKGGQLANTTFNYIVHYLERDLVTDRLEIGLIDFGGLTRDRIQFYKKYRDIKTGVDLAKQLLKEDREQEV